MARPFSLPEDNRELEDLIRAHGQAEVARLFGVTRQAVSIAVRDRKLNLPRRDSYKEYIPWVISIEEDKWAHPVRMLRLYAKRQMGKAIPETEGRRLDAWLAELDKLDAVVTYTPEDRAEPWKYVRRKPGDRHYTRKP